MPLQEVDCWSNPVKESSRIGSALPRVRNAVKTALANSNLTRTKVIAAVVRLIDVALLRPGYDEYAREHGGRGAATLLKKDVAVEGDKIVVEFRGKGGKQIKQEVEDRSLSLEWCGLSRHSEGVGCSMRPMGMERSDQSARGK